jgi:ribosome maturation factor RimP
MEVFMKLVLEKLKIDLQERLDSEEIIVDDVTFEEKGKYHFLTVTLDKIGGIDLETIVDATKIVNEVVDKADITDDSYILDVVSKERGE